MGDSYEKDAYKIIYQHPDWQSTAQEYEDKFAANLYNYSPVRQAASMALTKLSQMLVSYYRVKNLNQEQAEDLAAVGQVAEQVSGRTPDDWKVLEGALLQRNSGSGAGQIGRFEMGDYVGESERKRLGVEDENYPLFQPDADLLNQENIQDVFDNGNLREQMTMLYNGMFLSGGRNKEEIAESRSLKNLLLNITEEDQEKMNAMGTESNVRFDLLREMGQYEKKEDLFDTYSMARDLKRGKDKIKGRGNRFTRWAAGIRRAFSAALSSKFTRSTKKKKDQAGLGLEHYKRLGIGLSQREMSNGLDENGNLKWKEGQAYFRMDTPVTADGMLQTAGPSGTTLRMLGAYRLLGASKNDLLNFRLALIAWMVSSRDHSLYEILVGSHNAGVKGREDISEAANMYRTVDPLYEDMIRELFAPNRRFPHETIYLKMVDQQLKDTYGDGLINPDNEEDVFDGVSAYGFAARNYSSSLYKVMNTSSKYGELAGHIRVWMMDKTLPKDVSEEYRKEIRGIQKTAFDMAKVSQRLLSDGLEVWGSYAPKVEKGQEELESYSRWRAYEEEGYKDRWMDLSHAFRGITYRGGKLSSAMKSQGSFVTDSFYSTSLLPSVAMHFYDICKEKEENKAIFRFRLEGKGAINITAASVYGDEEMEVLVPRGSVFQVLDAPQPAYYNKITEEVVEESKLSEEKKAAVIDELQWGEESVWQKVQLVNLQEVKGPGEERRKRSEAKDKKRQEELKRLKKLWEGPEATQDTA